MTERTLKISRRAALGAIGAALTWPRAALSEVPMVLTGHAFGTTWRLVAPSVAGAGSLARGIEALFADIDRTFSPWRPDSTISRFNTNAPQRVDPAFTEVADAALRIARASDGAFDPTVGPLVARWGFGPITVGGAPDWRALRVGSRSVTKSRDDLTLDFCGIAKGWALDRAGDFLKAEGVRNFLFDLGGEFIAEGLHPDGREWRIAVDGPRSAPLLRLPSGVAVATSGTWAQSYRLRGRTYSHIIDPGAQAPMTGGLRSVTVIARNATAADGWATALCAAGESGGPDLAHAQSLAALFLVETRGQIRQVRTGSIDEFLL